MLALPCCHAAAAAAPGSGADPPLGLLVGKLLGALAASEKFAVQLNPISAQPSMASLYAGGYYRSNSLHSECASGGAAGMDECGSCGAAGMEGAVLRCTAGRWLHC